MLRVTSVCQGCLCDAGTTRMVRVPGVSRRPMSSGAPRWRATCCVISSCGGALNGRARPGEGAPRRLLAPRGGEPRAVPDTQLLVRQRAKLRGAFDGILDFPALAREMPRIEQLGFRLGVAARPRIPGASHQLDAQRATVGVAH